MPFGLDRAVLVTTFEGHNRASACLDVPWGDGARKLQTTSVQGRTVGTVAFADQTDSLAVVPLESSSAPPRLDGCLSGSGTWAIVGLEAPGDLGAAVDAVVSWQAGATGPALAAREIDALDRWRVASPAGLSDPETKLWRQSETILRMAQIRQPNTDQRHAHGLVLASLPAGEWFIPWVRDMSYATVALARMGHQAEARDALLAYFDAQPIGVAGDLARNLPYQISTVRYFGDGSEEADFTEQGERNVELDSWGLALWALSEYVAKYRDNDLLSSPTYRGTVYESARDFVVKPLLGNLDAVPGTDGGQIVGIDTSCWEENGSPRKHYAFSTIAAINGLRSFVSVAQARGDQATADDLGKQVASLTTGFEASFVKDGRIKGTVERSPKDDMNGAVLEAFNWGVETNETVIAGTLAKMPVLARASGGFRRVTGPTSYERHEFLFIDFAMARIFLRRGQRDKAAELIQRTVQRSSLDHGFIPEMYVSVEGDRDFPGKIGDPTGAIPMVGYGAGIFAITMMERVTGDQ
jgi:GH15 family glucan-1,4-alpha-glucosidase